MLAIAACKKTVRLAQNDPVVNAAGIKPELGVRKHET